MKIPLFSNSGRTGECGATAVFVALILVILIGFTALAVDIGHLYGVRNELHNAADAGALAGARKLFDEVDSHLTVDEAIAEATRITPLNASGNEVVDDFTVEVGHWSFTEPDPDLQFTPSANTTQVEWQERPFSELDDDPDFINAVRVTTRRPDTPSFFARIFGIQEFFVAAKAVAYLGFTGGPHTAELDQPIAICKQAITDPECAYTDPDQCPYTCNMGRMLNSGPGADTSNTGAWTNFTQPCQTASTQSLRPLICGNGNPNEVQFGEGIGSTNGVQDVTLGDFADCWMAATGGTVPWKLTLPVIDCPDPSISNCAPLIGAVTVNVLWIIHQNDPQYNNVPTEMTIPWDASLNWSCTGTDEASRFACWRSFVDHFNLQNVSGPPQSDEDYAEMYQKKNIIFLPDCTPHEPTGDSGGQNFGILAKIPKLVQ